MKLPYGFDAQKRHWDDDPWVNLATINEFLEDQQPVPPDLAQWLGHAIRYANRDLNEFLKRLGLKAKRGRQPRKHAAKAWLEWGERVCRREDNGERPEAAINAVMQEYTQTHSEGVSRSVLQKWRDDYRGALIEARCR